MISGFPEYYESPVTSYWALCAYRSMGLTYLDIICFTDQGIFIGPVVIGEGVIVLN